MENCLFCKIISGEIPSTKVYEDDFCVCLPGYQLRRRHHVLLIPKTHPPWVKRTG